MLQLTEATRNQLMNKSKSSQKGNERLKRKNKSSISKTVKEFNSIDMNKLFKEDVLTVNIKVNGETDNYIVRITVGGFLLKLQDILQPNQKVDLRIITKALIQAFNSDNVYVHCTCLHPNTCIKLLDGTNPTVEELKKRFDNGEELYTYSVNDKGDFEPAKINKVWITGESTRFIKITLDNDECILTTPEHLYMLRDGSYEEAQNLQIGQSLMPLYFNSANGYELIKFNSKKGYQSTYKMVANFYKQELIEEAKLRVKPDDNMSYDVAIHHVDFNKNNNNPNNLQIMTAKEHWEYHASLCGPNRPVSDYARKVAHNNAVKRNANPTPAMLEQRRKFVEAGRLRNYDEDRKEQQRQIMQDCIKKYWDNLSEEDYVKRCQEIKDSWTEDRKKVLSKSQKINWDNNVDRKIAASQRFMGNNNPAKRPEVRQKMSESAKKRERSVGLKCMCKDNVYKFIPKDLIQQYLQDGWVIKGFPKSNETKQKISNALKNSVNRKPPKQYTKEEYQEFAIRNRKTRWTNNINELLSQGIEVNAVNFDNNRKSGEPRWQNYFESFDEIFNFLDIDISDKYNHKIKAIEYVSFQEPIPTYDIKVDNNQNFLVSAGVILHNCPDFLYRYSFVSTQDNYNSGEPQSIPANITNPDDSLGSACKHVLLVLSQSNWLLKIASVCNNYINYMEKHYKKAYQTIIYPAIYDKEYEEPIQMEIDDVDKLAGEEDSEILDTANEYGRTRSQFKTGNQMGIRFAKKDTLVDEEEPEQTTMFNEE